MNTTWGSCLLDLEELAKANDYEATANAGLMAACREVGGEIGRASCRERVEDRV